MESASDHKTSPPKADTAIRKRRATACTRCNTRRTKCDASVNGLPCTSCKKTNNGDTCQFVQSKRTRGPDGRYILPDFGDGQPPSPTKTEDAPRLVEERQSMVAKTAIEPEINLDLAKLCGVDNDSHSGGEDPREKGRPADADESQDDTQVNFVGESWYAAYVLTQSAAGHQELHKPFEGSRRSLQPTLRDGPRAYSIPGTMATRKPRPADLPPQHLTEKLLEAYFKRFHLFCPILDRASFLTSVRDCTVSITLLRSVLFVSVIHCEPEVFHLMGYSTRLDAGDDLWNKAVASFDSDRESDRTTMVLSAYMLHYWFGKPTHYRDSVYWLGNAIRSAQCMGYHRSTKHSGMSQRDKNQWKRVWWCLYIRDRQICLSLGAPMVINDLDFDVEELTVDDFQDESPETARYMVAAAGLNRAASSMYFCHCSPSRLPLSCDSSVRQQARREIQSALEEWYTHAGLHSDNHHLTLLLKTCYNYYIINLQQRLQRLCPKPDADIEGSNITLKAANNISRLVEDSLLYWAPEYFPMIYISAIFTAMTACVAQLGISIHSREQLAERLRPSLLALKQFESCYVLAKWVRNLFMDIVNRPIRPLRHNKSGRRRERALDHEQGIWDEQSRTPESIAHSVTARSDSNSLPAPEADSTGTHGFCRTGHPSSSEPPSDHSSFMYSPFLPHDSVRSTDAGSSMAAAATIGFTPNFITYSDEFMPVALGNMADFPSPTSLEYQSLHFLADLGLSGYSHVNHP